MVPCFQKAHGQGDKVVCKVRNLVPAFRLAPHNRRSFDPYRRYYARFPSLFPCFGHDWQVSTV